MTLRLNGDSSGFTEIKAADAAGDNSITLPTSNGGANELLKNGGTAGSLEFATDIVVDSSDRLLVGTSTFAGTGGGAKLQVINDDGSDTRTITVGEDGVDQKLHLGLLDSGTSYITWGGHYDSGWNSDDSANLLCMGALTLSSTTTGSSISFRTTANANSSPLTHVEIESDGTLALKSTCPGIDFSGIQTNAAGMTSETLDSYEEGTWTPLLRFGGGSTGITYHHRSGQYTKIGNVCILQFGFRINSKGTDVGTMDIASLPFSSFASSYNHPSGGLVCLDPATANLNKPLQAFTSGTTIQLRFGLTNAVPTNTAVLTNTSIFGTLVYHVA